MIFEFLLYFLSLIAILILVNSIGKITLCIINIKPEKKFFRIFLELVSGVIILVFIYSVIKTKFLTVNILFLFLIVSYIFFIAQKKITLPSKKCLSDSFRTLFKDIIFVLIPCSLPFFLFEMNYLYPVSGIRFPHADYFFYSELSDSLNNFGKENLWTSRNILFPDHFKGIQPYHYFELWLNAFISKLFHFPSIYSLLLISYPCLNCIVFIGLIALWESFQNVKPLSVVFIFILLLTNAVSFDFFNTIIDDYNGITQLHCSLFSLWGKKYSPVYIFFILFLLLYIKDKKIEAFVVLSSLQIVTVLLLPGVFFCVFLFLLLNKFHHTFSSKDNRKLLIFYTIFIFLFFILYFIFGYFEKNSTSDYLSEGSFLNTLLSDFTNMNHYKYLFGIMMYRSVRYFLSYAPYIIIAVVILTIFFKRDIHLLKLIILVMLCNVVGLFAFGFALEVSNSWQFFSTTFIFINCLLIYIFMLGFDKLIQSQNKTKKYLLGFCFIALILLNIRNSYKNNLELSYSFKTKYSDKYISSVLDETGNQSFLTCAALYSMNDYKKNVFYEYLFVEKPGRASQLVYGYRDMIDINNFLLFDSIPTMINTDKYYILNSSFYLFTKKQKDDQTFVSYEKSQVDFINTYNIKYIFATKDAPVSDLLLTKTRKKIVDSLSGERFYIISDENSQ